MGNVKLLDCTLRDGGYVNDWNWGFGAARDIIATLTRAGVDIVEVGFLRNIDAYTPDRPLARRIEDLDRLLPAANGRTMYAGMAMRSNYDITQLSPYSGEGIELIRITAHDYDIREGMDFAREVKARGYKLSINPINIMGYADKDILWILDQVNAIAPYQFSIVDTFGSMRRRDLERILSLVDHDLDPAIRVGLHLHENMALSFCLAQEFIDKHLRRNIHYGVAVVYYGAEFFFKPLSYAFGQGIAVNGVSFFHTCAAQFFFRPVYLRREFALWYRQQSVYAVRDEIGVFNYYPAGSLFSQISKLFHHLVGSPQIQSLPVFSVLVTLTRHDDISVYGGSVPVIVSIGGSNYRFVQFLSQRYNLSVYIFQLIYGQSSSVRIFTSFGPVFCKKSVVYQRLYLKIIIKFSNLFYLFMGLLFIKSLIQFSCFTGRTYDYSLSVGLYD